MLPQLQAERQLRAIEAAVVPHMKTEDAKSVTGRYRRQLEDRATAKKPASGGLFEAFQRAGLPIVYEEAKK